MVKSDLLIKLIHHYWMKRNFPGVTSETAFRSAKENIFGWEDDSGNAGQGPRPARDNSDFSSSSQNGAETLSVRHQITLIRENRCKSLGREAKGGETRQKEANGRRDKKAGWQVEMWRHDGAHLLTGPESVRKTVSFHLVQLSPFIYFV